MQRPEPFAPTADTPRMSPWMWVPPPLLFALPLVVSAHLQRRLALPLIPGGLGRALAVLTFAAAVFFIPTAPILFALHRTTLVPHGRARALIASGPYRVTRNPMYVGLALIYLGVSFLLGSAWPLLFVGLPLWVMHTRTIPFEERVMEARFGDQFRAYKGRVRRWL